MGQRYFRESRKAWYIVHRDKQVRLGKDKDEAFQRWHELQRQEQPAEPDMEVAELIGQFLEWCLTHRAPETFKWYQFFLISFGEFLGDLELAGLKPHHVTRWMEHRKFKGNTGNGAVRTVMACFNWAVKYGKLKENPVKGVDIEAKAHLEVLSEYIAWRGR